MKRTDLLIYASIIIGVAILWWLAPFGSETTTDAPATVLSKATSQPSPQSSNQRQYVGTATCGGCHAEQLHLWRTSHHAQAMQRATADTVKANFDNQRLDTLQHSSHFYRQQNKYMVSTQGADGKPADYEVLYTLGTEPLQQYIVAFPDGRLQVLPLAWDLIKKKWFHVQQALAPEVGEWIHWTQGGMNWNSMCADCHTTDLRKKFDRRTNQYDTTWSEITVGCEACHGPGRAHTEAMQKGLPSTAATLDMNGADTPQVLVEKCARCHARRQALTTVFTHDSDNLLDHYLPEILRAGLYYSDGQIQDEVFVYGSFVQSKMYHHGVSCNSCHNPHSGALKLPGKQMCMSCHLAEKYDVAEHHHHSDAGELAAGDNPCVDCHMPGKIYMSIDFRRDHSFRIPRPDLSVQYNTPNTCNSCHQQQSAQWAADAVKNWFGDARPAHFSETLALAGADPQAAIEPLLRLLNDKQQPAIARATAAASLAPLISRQDVFTTLQNALRSADALLRATAADAFYGVPAELKTTLLAPLLADEIRAVRIAAASALSEVSPQQISARYRQAFVRAQKEYQIFLTYNADFAAGNHQQGVDKEKKGQPQQAAAFYLRALSIDDRYNISRMNLAHLRYRQQRLDDAETLYRKVIEQEPGVASPMYMLALLLAEKGGKQEAEQLLQRAADNNGGARVWYNLAVLRHQQQKLSGAEQAYQQAIAEEPANAEFLLGLITLYVQQEQWRKADRTLAQALQQNPAAPQLLQLQQMLRQQRRQ